LRRRRLTRAVEISPQTVNADLEVWEHHLETEVENDPRIADTEREALIIARCGQGLSKERVMLIEKRCRITRVSNPIHLRASHCKPWRDSNNEERLNGENGLLLTPSIDHSSTAGLSVSRIRQHDRVAGRTQALAEPDGCRDGSRFKCRLVHRGTTAILGLPSERGAAASDAVTWDG
jgi:HNH endonuclease